ncbi:hypothetical protein [uncultured Draconibacterium sp.]|nr:hypothetical protein [uncultured Draconibacterium sp.]
MQKVKLNDQFFIFCTLEVKYRQGIIFNSENNSLVLVLYFCVY